MTGQPIQSELDVINRKTLLDLRAFLARPGSDGLLHDADFQVMGELGMNPGRLRPAVEWLCSHGWLRRQSKGYVFTAEGATITDRLIDTDDNLPIEASRETRAAAADAASALARVASQNNQLSTDHPDRLPMYRASIEAGAGVLRAYAPTRALVRATLLGPANWIMQQAATAAVRDAAEHAIRLLTGLL